MAPPRTRKRVRAIQRAPDGSAFKRCDDCGILVAFALADMHQCEDSNRTEVKKFRGINPNQKVAEQCFSDQPRSAFRYFMEERAKTIKNVTLCEVEFEREGFECWKGMSISERLPYFCEAEAINSAYAERLQQEGDAFGEVDDEADSGNVRKFNTVDDEADTGNVGKFDMSDEDSGRPCCPYSTNCDDWLCLHKGVESLDTWIW